MQSIKDHTIFTNWEPSNTEAVFPVMKNTSDYMAILFLSICLLPFLTSKIDNPDPLFALVITPGFYLHPVDVADQDPASDRL